MNDVKIPLKMVANVLWERILTDFSILMIISLKCKQNLDCIELSFIKRITYTSTYYVYCFRNKIAS